MLKSHTAVHLADIICTRLKFFEIDLKQILTITTDNGANMLKMIHDIEVILQNEISNNARSSEPTQTSSQSPCKSNKSNISSIETDDEKTDDEISIYLAEKDDATDEEALEEMYDDILRKSHENMLSAISLQMFTDHSMEIPWDIAGVNCSAHTLQLAVKSALKKLAPKHSNVISLCRRVAKLLRLSSTHHEMNELGKKYRSPRLDVETRWSSTYMMVCISVSLLEFQFI